ncbi:hypothetical protein [Rhizorhabdus wittichii]|uniref:hypothetical protein n=1 Tax=Rhizorhabdus wittichii TaxID=160791 RepID=UPI0002FD3D84|nr:hypothetical protein [Rhizorhabdus wittichii]
MDTIMSTATLVRTHHGAKTRARETYETDPQVETLYRGDLAGAIAAARSLPTQQRASARIETDEHFYGPDLFDTMTAESVPLADYDLIDGSNIVRLERGALELLRGDRHMMPAASILNDQVEVITVILRHKKTIQDVEELDGRRLIRITAADIEAA